MNRGIKLCFMILLVLWSCSNEEIFENELVGTNETELASKGKPEKITICHYEVVTNTWKQMSVHPNALDNHLAHGDIYDEYCPDYRLDDDNDGITNDLELCPETPEGEAVDADGCSQSQLGYITEITDSNASKWFGGDDRTNIGPRNIGTGQSIILNRDYILNSFSVKFFRQFDYSQDYEGQGHEVVVTLQLRNSSGEIIAQTEKNISDSFNGGWVVFEFTAPQYLLEFNSYIFTWYLNNGFTNNLFNGSMGNSSNIYELGTGYSSGSPATDSGFDEFSIWYEHPWDFLFILGGDFTN